MKHVEIIDGNEVTTYTTFAPSGREVVIGEEVRYTRAHGPTATVGSSWEGLLNCEHDPNEEYHGCVVYKESLEDFDDYHPHS